MNNAFMRIIVFFDLPVTSKAQRRSATQFRQALLKDGYYMIQFSVYGRLCANRESATYHEGRLLCSVPANGSVRVMTVTEKQYTNMRILSGDVVPEEKPVQYIQTSFF